MKVNYHTSVRLQVVLFAFTLVYALSALLRFQATDNFRGEPKYPEEFSVTGILGPFQQEQKMVFTDAATVNASDAGIIWEKEFLLLPVIFFLSLLLFFRVRYYLQVPAPYLGFQTLYLFRVLPNAP
jgi:hypothetical protein